MTAKQLTEDIKRLSEFILADYTDKATVKAVITDMRPVKAVVSIRAAGFKPAELLPIITGESLAKAWQEVWPFNMHGRHPEKAIRISQDGKSVLFELYFATLTLETPDELT